MNHNKKSFTEEAAQGTSVFDLIAGGASAVSESATDTRNTQGAQETKRVGYVNIIPNAPRGAGRPRKYEEQMERLHIKLPLEMKLYLQEAIYKDSAPGHMVTITEYIIKLICEDMERNQQQKEE